MKRTGATMIAWPLRTLPRIFTAARAPLDDVAYDTRYHSPTHALHLHDYRGTLRMEGRDFDLTPDTLTLSPARGDSAYDLPAPGEHLVVHFWPARGGPTTRLPVHLHLGLRRAYVAQRLNHIIHLFAQRRGRGGTLHQAAASAALQELLLYIAALAHEAGLPPRRTRADAALDELVEILNANLDQPLDVPRLAERVGLSQNYLARQFRRRFGMTVPRYLLWRRIDTARHLLVNTPLPIGRIAVRVGLPDPQHFNKQFRRLTGQSPSAARQR